MNLDNIQENKELLKLAIKKDYRALNSASNDLKNDFDVVYFAVNVNGDALKFASKNLKNNFDIVDLATKKNPDVLIYASEVLKSHPKLLAKIVKKNILYLDVWIIESQYQEIMNNLKAELKTRNQSFFLSAFRHIDADEDEGSVEKFPDETNAHLCNYIIENLNDKNLNLDIENNFLKNLVKKEIDRRAILKVTPPPVVLKKPKLRKIVF